MKSLAAQSLVSKIGYLKLGDLVGPYTGEAERVLSHKLPGRFVDTGEPVYLPVHAGPALMLIRKGGLNLFRPFGGEKLFIKKLGRGAVFGEMSALGQTMHGAQAEAAEPSETVLLIMADIDALAGACPGFALRLARELGPRLAEAQKRYEMLAFQQVDERVASLLLELADSEGEINDISQQEIADQIGVYRETVSLAMAELKRVGLIEASRRKVKLLNVEGLRAMTSF
ncbi:MAG TPA: Crp/Fnr family transcriptional regulator, partial [Blastocatellia bacterium]|nr:Crp/Fnr family transcriptional regulator [Blastocatellia bacterium]